MADTIGVDPTFGLTDSNDDSNYHEEGEEQSDSNSHQKSIDNLVADLQTHSEQSDSNETHLNTNPEDNFFTLDQPSTSITHITTDLTPKQLNILTPFKNTNFHPSDEMMIDLFLILKASNAPMILHEWLINWVKSHNSKLVNGSSSLLQKRSRFIENMNKTLFKNGLMMKPCIERIKLKSGRFISVVTFSFEKMVLIMLTNTNLFKKQNLVLDPENIFTPPKESDYYANINEGYRWKAASEKLCIESDQILTPFIFFIDFVKIDKYGKSIVEAALACCAWFNKNARNRAGVWCVQGFVQDQTLFRDQDCYIRDDMAQDYHDMMTHIFKDFKRIQDAGGMRITININAISRLVMAIPDIALIIGDFKGNYLLCVGKGGHHTLMNGLCRDCTISTMDEDTPYIDQPLLCQYITRNHIVGKSSEELEYHSFLPIDNCFSHLSFGGGNRSIWGATPAEILHAAELGLCEYIADRMGTLFTLLMK